MDEKYILNPKTKRFIQRNGTLHKKLMRDNPEIFTDTPQKKVSKSYKDFKDEIKNKDPVAIERLRKLAKIVIQ